jgi:hypothetical protein
VTAPNGVVVNVIHNMPGLPYSRAFRDWEVHTDQCGECQAAMADAIVSGYSGSSDLLCEAGSLLDSFLRRAIEFQRDTSFSN